MYLEEKTSPGQTIKLTVLRDGKPLTLTVTLDARSGANRGMMGDHYQL